MPRFLGNMKVMTFPQNCKCYCNATINVMPGCAGDNDQRRKFGVRPLNPWEKISIIESLSIQCFLAMDSIPRWTFHTPRNESLPRFQKTKIWSQTSQPLRKDHNNRELKHLMFLSHGRHLEVNISHTLKGACPAFSENKNLESDRLLKPREEIAPFSLFEPWTATGSEYFTHVDRNLSWVFKLILSTRERTLPNINVVVWRHVK